MKILLTVVITLAVGGGIVALVNHQFKPAQHSEANAIAVRVEPVKRGELVEFVTAPGQVQPRIKVQISARVAARIVEIPHGEGSVVTRGDPDADPPVPASVLVRLDATELEAQLRAAEARANAQRAQITEAEARTRAREAQLAATLVMLKDAERDLKRQLMLLESKDVSQATVDQAQAKVDQLRRQYEAGEREMEANAASLVVLQHQIEAAEAEIAKARDNLAYTTITSPIDGVITRENAKAGEMVVMGTMNNPGTVILEVSDLSEMQVDAQIDETSVALVQEGQRAKVRIAAYPDKIFDGIVKLVGMDTAEQRQGGGFGGNQGRWYRTRLVLDTQGLRIPAGLSADVDIETRGHTDVLLVPTPAVLGRAVDELPESLKSRPEVDASKVVATVVYCVNDGKAVLTPVTIGASDMNHTMIVSGLQEGDQVIVGPFKLLPTLQDGTRVKVEAQN